MNEFVADLKAIKDRARRDMEQGAVTDNCKADRAAVVKVLSDALATDIVCFLRYQRHYYTACAINSEAVRDEFLQHARQEQEHADQVATRIIQLNGQPNFNPEGLASRSHSEYSEGRDLVSMIREDLFAERIAIESYAEIVRWLGDPPPAA